MIITISQRQYSSFGGGGGSILVKKAKEFYLRKEK